MQTSKSRGQEPRPEARLQEHLDALVCGECTEDEFVAIALALFNSKFATNLLVCIDQYYRRGQLPAPLFHSIKAKITQRALERAIDEMDESVRPPSLDASFVTSAKPPPPREPAPAVASEPAAQVTESLPSEPLSAHARADESPPPAPAAAMAAPREEPAPVRAVAEVRPPAQAPVPVRSAAREPAPPRTVAQEPAPVRPAAEEPAPVHATAQERAPSRPAAQVPAPPRTATQEPAPVLPAAEGPSVRWTVRQPAPAHAAAQESAPLHATQEPLEPAPIHPAAAQEPAPPRTATEESAPKRPAAEEPAPVRPTTREAAPILTSAEEPAAVQGAAQAGIGVAPAATAAGLPLHRYHLVKRLCGDGDTDLFEATDTFVNSSEEIVRLAVKVLREPADRAGERGERLRREFDCMRRLSHPNIAKVHDFGQDETNAFYTLEALEGEFLCDLIERRPLNDPLPQPYAWAIVGAIGCALVHAHARGVIHGDLRPSHVLIGHNGELRVLNFGASAIATHPSVSDHAPYASCELIEGRPPDPRDDVYALACLACELLGGQHPFAGRRATEARDARMRALRPAGISFTQWRSLQSGLAWSREARPATLRQWLAELGFAPEPAALPPLEQAPARAPESNFERLLMRGGLSLAAILAIAFAWNVIGHRAVKAPLEAPATASAPAAQELDDHSTEVWSAEAPVANPPAARHGARSSLLADAPESGAETATTRKERAAAARTPVRPTIKFTAKRYPVRPGTSFAEIHVQRSRASKDLSDFIWWTEDASARSGVDFVAQDRARHAFAEASPYATLFVRLLPHAGRAQPATFQVCAGKPSGSTLTDVTCSAVVLPPFSG